MHAEAKSAEAPHPGSDLLPVVDRVQHVPRAEANGGGHAGRRFGLGNALPIGIRSAGDRSPIRRTSII